MREVIEISFMNFCNCFVTKSSYSLSTKSLFGDEEEKKIKKLPKVIRLKNGEKIYTK